MGGVECAGEYRSNAAGNTGSRQLRGRIGHSEGVALVVHTVTLSNVTRDDIAIPGTAVNATVELRTNGSDPDYSVDNTADRYIDRLSFEQDGPYKVDAVNRIISPSPSFIETSAPKP